MSVSESSSTPYIVDANVRIGHVHLKVADLRRALQFLRWRAWPGSNAAIWRGSGLPFGGRIPSSHCAETPGKVWEGRRRRQERPGCITRQSFIPTRAALATALRRVLAAKIPLQGAADHGVSESI